MSRAAVHTALMLLLTRSACINGVSVMALVLDAQSAWLRVSPYQQQV
jgi:hypothetical protein